jgi:hypothetical protein
MGTLASILGSVTAFAGSNSLVGGAGFRPPQWTNPGITTPPVTLTAMDPVSGQQTAYVFDGIPRGEHEQRTVITKIPVQTGAALSDHAYIEPPSLMIEIAMSDAMQSFVVGQFADSPSRSISAYQTLRTLQSDLSVVQVATRLWQYSNMMITSIRALEDYETNFGLKAIVTLDQILTANVDQSQNTSTQQSADPQATNSTTTGQVQPSSVPASIDQLNNIQNTGDDE